MKNAFTLIELLVVITIIVVLLALLAPALDKAIYQAELAVCAANLKGIATGAMTYAAANRRLYPHRPTLREGATWKRPNNIVDPGYILNPTAPPTDDRPYLKDYFSWDLFADPLAGKINIGDTRPGIYIFTNYELWFGAQFPGESGLMRLGNRLSFAQERFSVLAGDENKIMAPGTWAATHCAHPDDAQMQSLYIEPAYILSRWQETVKVTGERGAVDAQYVFTDGSVERFGNQQWDEYQFSDRMARLPINTATSDLSHWSYVPRR